MRTCPLVILALAACSGSGDRDAGVAAAAVIGPEGGVLAADSGPLAGLRLTVPAGALAEPTLVRVRELPAAAIPETLPAGALPLSSAPPPGVPFALEPPGLRLEERATLRAPYEPQNLGNTAPGNVRLRERRNGNLIDYEPDTVDVGGRFVELPIRWLSEYLVVRGPVAAGIASYVPPEGAVDLGNGVAFAVEPVPPESPFAGEGAVRWRFSRPESADLLYFVGNALVGREAELLTPDWRERWQAPQPAWVVSPGAADTFGIQVERPIGALPVGGTMTAACYWAWSVPRPVAGRLLYDVVELHVRLAWNRQDLGVGQRDYVFRFAPGIGLVNLVEDGVPFDRQSF